MNTTTRPSITRLARKAGVKSISDDCFNTIRKIIDHKVYEILDTALIVNSEHQTKTLMIDDIYNAIHLLGYNITQSNEIGTSTCSK